MISRHWTGISRRDQADAYVTHLQMQTFPRLMAMAGFVRAAILRREIASGTEFQIVTVWESLEAIRAFTGPDLEAAVVPPVVRDMMVEWEDRVSHYEVAHTTG